MRVGIDVPRSRRPVPARPGTCAACNASSPAGRARARSSSRSAGAGRAATCCAIRLVSRSGSAGSRADLDVLHCTTMRGPLRAPAPVVVTVHDLAVLRYPERVSAWHRHTGRARPAGSRVRVPRTPSSRCPRSPRRDRDLLDVPGDRDPRRPERRSTRLHGRRSGAPRRLRARCRDARAAQESGAGGRGSAACRRRAAGRRGARVGRSRGAGLGRTGWRRGARRALSAARAAWSCRRCTRASGYRSSRRWHVGRRS